MDGGRLFTAIGLVRLARPGGFCPACRVLMKALDARQELAKPTVAALVVLAVAGVAWAANAERKSTRLNSSHPSMSLAAFFLEKKNTRNARDRADEQCRSEEHTSELESTLQLD